MEPTLRDQVALGEKRVVEPGVTADDPIVDAFRIRLLQVAEPGGGVVVMTARPEDLIGMAVDVHEPGVGKHFQQQPDARGVGRGLEDERALVFESQLFQKDGERGFPLVDFILRHAVEIEVARILVLPCGGS